MWLNPVERALLQLFGKSEEAVLIREGRMLAKKFSFDWEGGLSDLKEKVTSVELQYKALEVRES